MKKLFFVSKVNGRFEEGEGNKIKFFYNGEKIQGTLKKDYETLGDGIYWVMLKNACIKSNYTKHDMIEKKLFDEADVLEDGEVVEIVEIDKENMVIKSTTKQRFKALGKYSDCGVFEEAK